MKNTELQNIMGVLSDKINNYSKSLIAFTELLKNIKKLGLAIFTFIVFLSKLLDFEKIRSFLIEHRLLSPNFIAFLSENSNGIFALFSIILMIFLIKSVKIVAKRKIETTNYTYNIIYKLHNDLIHKTRDGIASLYSTKDKLKDFIVHNNNAAIHELQLHAFDNLVNNLQAFVDLISEHLSEYNNDIISVCIKIIDSGQENVPDLSKSARTLVRSKNTHRERDRNDEAIIVGKNTDFKYLCNGTNIWYHGVDLKTKYEKHEYETEAPEADWQSKYNSTIVVPIRYYNPNNGQPFHDILGFLCIDSKKIVSRWNNSDSYELQFLAIFADSLYSYIKLFREIFKKGNMVHHDEEIN